MKEATRLEVEICVMTRETFIATQFCFTVSAAVSSVSYFPPFEYIPFLFGGLVFSGINSL